MTASLASFQSSLGRALLGEDTCPINPHSAGFRFTMMVRRSWCEGRSFLATREIMKVMPDADRQRLLGEYVDQGGGLAWFLGTERQSFLAFLESRLPDPSHALTLCRMSQALARAMTAASTFLAPEQRIEAAPLVRGPDAALVWFYADPGAVITALNGGELPPLGPPVHPVFFAPGITNRFRIATEAETALWTTLAIADAPPSLVETLLREGVLAYPPA